jgi:serine-type D-Ala-D-Ala carboxypeptidase (penicillin-binding protein 5/6)
MMRAMPHALFTRFFPWVAGCWALAACSTQPPPPIRGQPMPPAGPRPAPLHQTQEDAWGHRQPAPPAGAPLTRPPSIVGESAIVIDAESGRVLYAKNPDERRAVASTQKILTALCVIDAGNLDKPVVIAPSDGACEPTKLYLKPGETYTRRELTKALMVRSANDVARALARDVAGSQEAFADRMNRKAASLGMRNSNFRNPHGLTEPGQFSTARDMAIAARAAYRIPLMRSFSSTRSYTFRFSDGRTRTLENTNKVLDQLAYCDGMKTGTTIASGRCLVSTGSHNGRSVIVVVLKSNAAHIWSDSAALLRWALESPAAGQ